MRLLSLRFVVLAYFLATVPALYFLALRLAPPFVAGLVTLLCVAWSFPNYFASVPSWINLSLALFGALALFRFQETQGRIWLFWAGVCGGLSFLAKMPGLYFVVAAFLFLVYSELATLPKEVPSPGSKVRGYLLFKAALSLLVIGFLVIMLETRLETMGVLNFLVPGVGVCTFLVWSEAKEGRGTLDYRSGRLWRLLLPFGLGVMLPIALFLVPYFLRGALRDLYLGVFVMPQKRLVQASMNFPDILTLLPVIPYAAVLLIPLRARPGRAHELAAAAICALLVAGLMNSTKADVYQTIWLSVRGLPVAAVLAGLLLLMRPGLSQRLSLRTRQQVFLLATLVAFLGLIQFPFAAPIYFCYTVPFVVLAVLAVVVAHSQTSKVLHLGLLGFYLLFAILRLNSGTIWNLGLHYEPYQPMNLLNLERGGLRVPRSEKEEYEELVRLIREKARSAYLYAAPDCPEVYFLSGTKNPTPKMYDFLAHEKKMRPERLLKLLDEKGVSVIVINQRPHFSGLLAPEDRAILEQKFPHRQEAGRFEVRWKE